MSDRTAAPTPLYDALLAHEALGRASFHTPGHKGRAQAAAFALPFGDLTELPDTASLFDGGDAAEEAERYAAQAFGAALTLFSAGGCTLCIQTMLLLAGGGQGGTVLMGRNAHRSAVHTAALLGFRPVWLWPERLPDGEGGPVSPATLETALAAHPDCRAVYLTSPDYFGVLADVQAAAALCRRAGVPLLIDNAHGSHLAAFGRHPLQLGAAMTADSAHKTLPVLTGGALLHLSRTGERPFATRQEAKAAMAVFGSTSPSFPILASLDRMQAWWRTDGADACRRTAEKADALRETARRRELASFRTWPDAQKDPLRLTLDTAQRGLSGVEAAAWFRTQGCEPEMADARHVVFLLSPFNTDNELSRLQAAIDTLPTHSSAPAGGNSPEAAAFSAFLEDERPEIACSPREALLCASITLPVSQTAGRVAARSVCPCPPGIAALVPGERISAHMAAFLERCGYTHLLVTGDR